MYRFSFIIKKEEEEEEEEKGQSMQPQIRKLLLKLR